MSMRFLRSGLSRRALLGSVAVLVAGGTLAVSSLAGGGAEPDVTVWKSPSCGCCGQWVAYLENRGYVVNVIEAEDIGSVKAKHGVPDELSACHTAIAGRYAIEGHVPAGAIEQLLATRPEIDGIAVPGMPAGSPGMSGAPQRLEVIGFMAGAAVGVFWTGAA